MSSKRRSLLFAALLPACTWTTTPNQWPTDTGDGPNVSCGALAPAAGFSLAFGQFTVDNERVPVLGAIDDVACADPTLPNATWPLKVDDVYAGTLSISAPTAGAYLWPTAPPTQFAVTIDAPSYGVTGTFSSWVVGTLQVTDTGDRISINVSNLASDSDAPSVNLSGAFTITR
jgi:hypothetical protein